MRKKILSTLTLLILTLPNLVLTQGNLNDAGKQLNKVAGEQGAGYSEASGDIGNFTGILINSALTLVGLIFLVLMVYGGYLWMTDRGNEDQVDKAKKIITAAIIGIAIIMGAYAITQYVTIKINQI